jgi:hypothetical protein
MDISQLRTLTPLTKTSEVSTTNRVIVANQNPVVGQDSSAPTEVFSPSSLAPTADLGSESVSPLTAQVPEIPLTETVAPSSGPLTWTEGSVTFTGSANGPITSFEQPVASGGQQTASSLTLAETLKALSSTMEKPTAQAMSERESGYLKKFPYKDDEASLQSRAALNTRYNDPTTSAASMTKTVARHAHERGIEIDKAPENLVGSLCAGNLDEVKKATQTIVDKLFLSQQASYNPEKHATVSKETARFLDLALAAAPKDFSAADAYKLVAGNLALISYQDKAAAENMLGDHGVRHLLGHNIKACEQLADGLEKRGVPVSAADRLVMHQAMIVHDLGYAMDSVRNPINSEGLKGQDAGHNVLAARYLRERSQDPDDPVAKLFGQKDLERMHRCVLYHDKDQNGGPGVNFEMVGQPTAEQRATNLETMTRVADNSHAFEDKLPELLYRRPQSLKTLRLMKTAGELGDKGLVETLKTELADQIKADLSLASDDREALLQSVSSVTPMSYQFSVGRIAGSKPSFDVSADGKVHMEVTESGMHQQTVSLFGMQSYGQMEKFIKDCAGEKVKLSGQCEVVEGQSVCVYVRGPHLAETLDEFNSEMTRGLLADKGFVEFSLLDTQLSAWQKNLEERVQRGKPGLEGNLEEVKAQRREMLEKYRSGQPL